MDFTAKLNGTTNSLGKTGVVPKIQSAAIAKDGTITVRVTIVDSNGLALDRLGVATVGPVSLSFIAAYPRGPKPVRFLHHFRGEAHAEPQYAAPDSGGQ